MQPLADDSPILICLPGLTGGSDDSYVRYTVHYAETHGMRAVVFNSRGCGDTFLTTPRYYSGLYIGDMQRVAAAVRARYPQSQLFACGWSLGANILMNYLGLVGEDTPIEAAAALCNPFDLELGSANLARGFNRVYSANLGAAMSRIMLRNRKIWNGAGPEFNVELACNAPTVRAWDEAITCVSFGMRSIFKF
jgi:predicted alpha/beta-fold hydrolase